LIGSREGDRRAGVAGAFDRLSLASRDALVREGASEIAGLVKLAMRGGCEGGAVGSAAGLWYAATTGQR